ncbi:hypothetical protein ACFYT4_31660 [Streptomyces sp. NPDC004609]|uniref:hypothetical protein n=1 Tax=Streptomyces sp. NPDC004609 TaxID=3364704 RepID=UPI0036B2C8DD
MAVRLILTVTDAVRRAARRHHCGTDTDDEPGLGEDAAKLAPGWAADTLRTTLPGDILTDLTASPAWPQLAGQLAALQHAGVDMTAGGLEVGQHQPPPDDAATAATRFAEMRTAADRRGHDVDVRDRQRVGRLTGNAGVDRAIAAAAANCSMKAR